jgi:hypothetical protein
LWSLKPLMAQIAEAGRGPDCFTPYRRSQPCEKRKKATPRARHVSPATKKYCRFYKKLAE